MVNEIKLSYPPVSVVIPILNEADHLRAAVRTILTQNYRGEIEIILAVGPSVDDTEKIANELAAHDSRIKVIKNPTGRTPNALNAGFAHAQFEIVVRIDGHSEIDIAYISHAVETMQKTNAVNVGGIMAAEGVTSFQKAVARAMRSKIGVGAARFHTGGEAGPTDTVYLGTFKKSAVMAIGGYNESFTRAQDWEMNYRLRQAGGEIWFDPRLVVTYRPRRNLRKLARQYFEYGRWRRAVSRCYPETINLRYLAPPVTVVITLASILVGINFNPIAATPLYFYLVTLAISSQVIGKSWSERFLLPIILFTMHFSWGIGFLTSHKRLVQGNLSK